MSCGFFDSKFEWVVDDGVSTFTYQLTTQLTYHPSNATTLALIKRTPTLDPTTPLPSQLHFLNLFGGEETPYESLHAVVSWGVKPWFDAFVGSRGGVKDNDSKMGTSFISSDAAVKTWG
jgi:hypothetical protein